MRKSSLSQYHKTGLACHSPFSALQWSLAAAAFLWATAPAAAKDEEAWILQQRSQLAGNHTIYVSSKGVLIENKANFYAILLQAPDWKVVIYNTKSKKACTKDVKEFSGALSFGSGMLGEGNLQALPLRKTPTEESIKGLKTNHYTTGQFASTPSVKKPRDLKNSIFEATDLSSADYWVWPTEIGPAKAGLVLQKIYRLPQRTGIPIALKYITTAGQKLNELDTISITKSKVPDTKFVTPKGLIATKTEHDVVFDESRTKKVNRAAEMFDSWRDTWDR